jgi:hypothetical protein
MSALAVYRKLDFSFPSQEEPKWASQIDRWYQLDAYAHGLAEAYFTLSSSAQTPPSMIILASSGASNHTDFQFARTGAMSPSKFVHTLPNVRGSSLCQIMGWKGPMLSIQNDPQTQITALREAVDLLDQSRQRIWVWSVSGTYTVHWFEVGVDVASAGERGFKIESASEAGESLTDSAFHEWLATGNSNTFVLPGNYVMRAMGS